MIALAAGLIAQGAAYERDGGAYFWGGGLPCVGLS